MYRSKINKYAKNNKHPAGKLTTTQTDPGVLGNIDINALDNLESETPKRARTVQCNNQYEDQYADDLFGSQNVPASQHTQQIRTCSFLSQRSNLAKTQSVRIVKEAPNNYFESILIQCGININDNDDIYTLSGDLISFVNRLRKCLQQDISFPTNIQRFLDGLTNELRDDTKFSKLMGAFLIQHPGSTFLQNSQNSLICNFQHINFIKDELIQILMNALKTYCSNSNEYSQKVGLIISSLHMVDNFNNTMIDQLFEIYESADTDCREIIVSKLPDIIKFEDHDAAARKLIEFIPNDVSLLSPMLLSTLNAMSLNPELTGILRKKSIFFLKASPPINLYLHLIKLALNFKQNEQYSEMINDFRSAVFLNCNWESTTIDTIKSTKREIFEFISRTFTKSKNFADQWIKCIQNSSTADAHRPFDIMIMLIYMLLNDDKSDSIKSMFKAKIKKNLIPVSLLEETIEQFSGQIQQNISLFLEICEMCFKDRDPALNAFGCSAYQLCFGIGGEKLLMKKLVEFVCTNSTTNNDMPFRTQIDLTTNALNLLVRIRKQHSIQMQSNGLHLLRILDQDEFLTLPQYRIVMDLLCSLAVSEYSEITQDNIDMLVKKQIGSSVIDIKKRGIIGGIREISYIVYKNETVDNMFDSDKSYSIEDLSPEITPAAYLITIMIDSASVSADTLALFYDELSLEFLSIRCNRSRESKHLDNTFLFWICHLFTSSLMSKFLADEVQDSGGKLNLKPIFNLNEEDEEDESNRSIINIGGLAIRDNLDASSSPVVLTSLFNITQRVYIARDHTLEGLNSLIGCTIILPELMEQSNYEEVFQELNEDEKKKVLDIYYYTANWFREIIGAFTNHRDDMSRTKVLKRLSQLIKIEHSIEVLSSSVSNNYKPPECHFLRLNGTCKATKSKKNIESVAPKKKAGKSKKLNPNITIPEGTENMSIFGTLPPNGDDENFYKYNLNFRSNDNFRQMDINIMLLLNTELDLSYPFPAEKIGTCLDIFQFKFIVEDMIMKLESLCGVGKFKSDEAIQYISSPHDLVYDLIYILPNLINIMDKFTENLQILREDCNPDQMYSERMNYLKICLGLCLRLLADLFMWPEFEKPEMSDLFIEALRILIKHPVSVSETESADCKKIFAKRAIKSVANYRHVIFEINSSVHLYHLTKSLAQNINDKESEKIIANLCSSFLKKTWCTFDGTIDQGARFNLLVAELLKGYFHCASLDYIGDSAQLFNEERVNLTGKNSLSTLQCINKTNCSLLYRELFEALIISIDDTISSQSNIEMLKVWKEGLNILDVMREITQANILQRNYVIFAKYSQKFIKKFMDKGMALVEKALKSKPEMFDLLKQLQKITRFLHKLCCHGKTQDMKAIISQIPLISRLKEDVLCRVKTILIKNNRLDLWKCENLKNRDLNNEEILSQKTISSTTDAEEEQEVSDDENFMDNAEDSD